MKNFKKYSIIAGIAVLAYLGGLYTPRQPEIKTVTKVQERERVRTVIEERPDGSKTTTIVADREKQTDVSHVERKPVDKKWLLGASAGVSSVLDLSPTYTLRVERRILWGAYAGLYGRTDGEFGVSLSYTF